MSRLNTTDLLLFASQELARQRHIADGFHSKAMAAPGDAAGTQHAACIDTVREWAGEIRLLASVVEHFGDHASAQSIREETDNTLDRLTNQAYEARMVSIPGWDPASRSFLARVEPQGQRVAA